MLRKADYDNLVSEFWTLAFKSLYIYWMTKFIFYGISSLKTKTALIKL
mgnify:CR=1 FL=1